MPRAREWADTFEEGIKAYGFGEDQIYRHKDTDNKTMASAICEIWDKIEQNAIQGRRTLLLCFYAGHAATRDSYTWALFNSNKRGDESGGNQEGLECWLHETALLKGAYVIGLLACSRMKMPEEEAKRGGTEATVPRPIQDPG